VTYVPTGRPATIGAGSSSVNGYGVGSLSDHEGRLTRQELLTTGYLNVRSFGADATGASDSAAAFNSAIAAAAAQDGTWSNYPAASSSRSAGATEIVVPNGVYKFTSKVTVPGNKNIVFRSESWHGARIVNATGGSYLFRLAAGTRRCGFRGFVFDGDGVGGLFEMEAGARGWTFFWDNRFEDSTDYAVKALGASVVYVDVYRNDFMHNVGCISNLYQDNDGWRIFYNNFGHNLTVPEIATSSTGVEIAWSDFEVRKDVASSYDQPWLHLSLVAGAGFPALTNIHHNRFGDETESPGPGGFTNGPPREAIVVGPIGSVSSQTTSRVRILFNDFKGTTGTASATQADSAIRFNAAPIRYELEGNTFGSTFFSSIVNEAYVSTQGGVNPHMNVWAVSNTVDPLFRGSLFSAGALGWDIVRPTDPARATTNLARDTEAIDSSGQWIKSGGAGVVTVTKDATGPDGVASSAYTVAKIGSGGAVIYSIASPTPNNANLTGSADLKAGTLSVARIAIFDTTASKYIATNVGPALRLSSEWERYAVTTTAAVPGNSVRLEIWVGGNGDSATGTILLAKPQLEEGRNATPYYQNFATSHSARQYGALTLGGRIIGYGTAAPGSGRYEIGDIIINTAPTAGGGGSPYIGWVCTTQGSPGTWKTFGAISA
jgi:hypothetical protein